MHRDDKARSDQCRAARRRTRPQIVPEIIAFVVLLKFAASEFQLSKCCGIGRVGLANCVGDVELPSSDRRLCYGPFVSVRRLARQSRER